MNFVCTRALALSLIAPATGIHVASRLSAPTATEVAAFRASAEPGLASMRAGRVAVPGSLADGERAELRAAQDESRSLGAMRGGEISDQQLTWLLLGAAIVLLIVLL